LRATEICKAIVGEKLQHIHRSLDLISIGFGDVTQTINRRGESVSKAMYYIHIQCPFRFVNSTGVVVGDCNLFEPFTGHDAVDLNEKNTSLFDSIVSKKNDELCGGTVLDVKVNERGDITIELTNVCIEVFVTANTDTEEWRFFRSGLVGLDVIVCGTGFDFDE